MKPDSFFIEHLELFLCERWSAGVSKELFTPFLVLGLYANGGVDAPFLCTSGIDVREETGGSVGRFGPPCVVRFGFRFLVFEKAVSPKPSGESAMNVCFKLLKVASGRWGVFEEFEGTVIVLNVCSIQRDDMKMGERSERLTESLYEDEATAMELS